MNKLCFILRYVRTEYAKRIRKDYEAGIIKERRCNMRQYDVRTDNLSNTITTIQKDNYLLEVSPLNSTLKIRKLTSKECFRLMGFDDEDHDILSENGIPNGQIYKMAGNSIVVDVLEEIFVNLLTEYREELKSC